MLSKKYYEMFAKVFYEAGFDMALEEKMALKQLAEVLADKFKRDNPRFDKAKFLKACGFGR